MDVGKVRSNIGIKGNMQQDSLGKGPCPNCESGTCNTVSMVDGNGEIPEQSDTVSNVTDGDGVTVDDDDFDVSDVNEFKSNSQVIYIKACTLFKVTPSNYFFHHVADVDVSMQNRTVGDIGIKAIATTMVSNRSVRSLNLADTGMSVEGLGYVLEMLEANKTIRELNMSHNCFIPDGVKKLHRSFINNQSVHVLHVSGNGFNDEDSHYLADIVEENVTLKEYHVGRNSLGEKAGQLFGKALENNYTMVHFDISWNHLRQRGAIELCYGLQKNTTLETLNLSWNGFGLEGCHELGKTLKVNRSLTDLDLSANRVSYDAFKLVLRGLVRNRSMQSLKIGCNPITTDGALAILRAVCDDRCKSLVNLDMSDVSVDGDFVSLLRKVQQRRVLNVKHGIMLRHDDLRKGENPVVLDTDDPTTILFECVKTRNLRLIDLLKNLDKDNSDTLSRDELRRGLEEIDVPLSTRSLDILMRKLDINQDGQVDYAELTLRYKEHMRRVARLQRDADVDLKHYKHFDRLEQLREMVRLRLSLSGASSSG